MRRRAKACAADERSSADLGAMEPQDLKDLVAYLRSLPPQAR
jgi:hypothetical protein